MEIELQHLAWGFWIFILIFLTVEGNMLAHNLPICHPNNTKCSSHTVDYNRSFPIYIFWLRIHHCIICICLLSNDFFFFFFIYFRLVFKSLFFFICEVKSDNDYKSTSRHQEFIENSWKSGQHLEMTIFIIENFYKYNYKNLQNNTFNPWKITFDFIINFFFFLEIFIMQ